MQKKNNLQISLILTAAAFLGGLLWRYRGEHGWGSSWGLLMFGSVLSLYLYSAFSEVKRLNVFAAAINGLAFMSFVPSWGSVVGQLNGYILPDDMSLGVTAEVSQLSAVLMSTILGLGVAGMFAFTFGFFLAEKPQKLRTLIIGAVLIFAVKYLAQATVSHLILDVVQPQAADMFEQCAAIKGIDGSAYRIYLNHFGDIAWAKKQIGVRNYFACINNISKAVAGLAGLVYIRIASKDKLAARTAAVVEAAFALSFSVSLLFQYYGRGGYRDALSETVPAQLKAYAWPMWEYSCGFLAVLIITVWIGSNRREIAESKDVESPLATVIASRFGSAFGYALVISLLLTVNIVRPIAERIADFNAVLSYVLYGIAAAITVAMCIMMARGKLPKLFFLGNDKALPAAFLLIFTANTLTYWLVGVYHTYEDASEANINMFFADIKAFGSVSFFAVLLVLSTLIVAVMYALFLTVKHKSKGR